MPKINYRDSDRYSKASGDWLSLKDDGDSVVVQFMFDTLDEIEAYACHKVEVDGKERNVSCLREYDDPVENCPFCEAGFDVKPVTILTMYDVENQKVLLWERGKRFMKEIEMYMNRYSDFSSHVFEIVRNGRKGDTQTRYQIFCVDDQFEPYDLSDIERPNLLGSVILDKSFEDCAYYVDHDSFPAENNTTSTSRTSSAPARRMPVNNTQAAANTPRRRRV